MTMRPKRPIEVDSRLMNSTTPTKISSGDSHDRSKENTTTIALVPMSAPSITASAAAVAMSPRPTKDETISPVAVLDCTIVVTAKPASSAWKRLPTLREMTWRRLAPNSRSTPVRTMCVAQTSRAMAASRFSRCCMAFDQAGARAGAAAGARQSGPGRAGSLIGEDWTLPGAECQQSAT